MTVMIIRKGWNSQYARRKFDIELGEEDLAALLIEFGFRPEQAEQLTPPQKYALLAFEADWLGVTGAISTGCIDASEHDKAVAYRDHMGGQRAGWAATLQGWLTPHAVDNSTAA